MSGHNKWSQIKRKKGVADAKRSQEFTKVARLITVAARDGGADPQANPTLRLAIEKAKEARMPKDNIQRAIDKGIGKLGAGERFESVTYEGFGPEGVAFLLKGITDNNNRTFAEIRTVFDKHGGAIGVQGSTAYLFTPDPASPMYFVDISDSHTAAKVLKLYDVLEEHEDIQEVFANFNIPDDVLEQL
ncbi:MAG: hypothetical protein RLY61_468 [Candidatus Parcubacteria bacterium]|jgi:YebC/PmpR family DNA-binding regulatory protein